MIRAALACLLLGGCFSVTKPTPPAPQVCPAAAMTECDTTEPDMPATAAETSADFAMDLATFFKTQRNECSAKNDAKAACINGDKNGKK